jgi:hypothetical protein
VVQNRVTLLGSGVGNDDLYNATLISEFFNNLSLLDTRQVTPTIALSNIGKVDLVEQD